MGVAVGLATKGLNFALEAAIIKTRSDEAATTMRQGAQRLDFYEVLGGADERLIGGVNDLGVGMNLKYECSPYKCG